MENILATKLVILYSMTKAPTEFVLWFKDKEIEQTGQRAAQAKARRKKLLALVDAFDDWLKLDDVTANAQLSDLVEKILVRAHHVMAVIFR